MKNNKDMIIVRSSSLSGGSLTDCTLGDIRKYDGRGKFGAKISALESEPAPFLFKGAPEAWKGMRCLKAPGRPSRFALRQMGKRK